MGRLLLSVGSIGLIWCLSFRASGAFSVSGFYLPRSGQSRREGVTARPAEHEGRRKRHRHGRAATCASSTASGAEPDGTSAGGSDASPVPTVVGSNVADETKVVSAAPKLGGSLPDVVEILGIRFERWTKDSDGSRKRVLLYLPGIEGLGVSIVSQLPGLSQEFDVFRMIIGPQDRSTFLRLSRAVSGFVDTVWDTTSEKIVVVGESFGGMLSLRLGQLRPDKIQCVFPVNPATSFGRTPWRSLGPLLTLAPKAPYTLAGLAVLAATIPDSSQAMNVSNEINGMSLTERPRALGERLGQMWTLIWNVSDSLQPETLRWRIQNWISAGQGRVDRGLRDMKVPVTVIAGSEDRLLPSREEAHRLESIIPFCRTVVLENHGHAPLYGSNVNFVDIITSDPAMRNGTDMEIGRKIHRTREMGIFSRDWVENFVMPDEAAVKEGQKQLQFFSKSLSPVTFSTREDGTSVAGLSGIPAGDRSKPIIFVGNHQLLALDLGLVVERILAETGVLPRGMAHPSIFVGVNSSRTTGAAWDEPERRSWWRDGLRAGLERRASNGAGDESGRVGGGPMHFQETLIKFGAVPVSPRNMYRLLKRGDSVLLFPGGVSEAYHRKGQAYQLFWPERAEFVRLAAEFNALIVPFSAIGIADSLEMILDGDEVQEMPIVGERVRNAMSRIPSARGVDHQEQFVAPFVLPKLPSRLYLRFAQPISLDGVAKKDRERCQEIYQNVKGEVELGISSLLRARESDPFMDPARRLPYERITGKPAPSFGASELDAAVGRARLAIEAKRRERQRRRRASLENKGESTS